MRSLTQLLTATTTHKFPRQVSCTDTLICDEDTLDEDDNPYPSVNFEGGVSGIYVHGVLRSTSPLKSNQQKVCKKMSDFDLFYNFIII